LKDQLVNGQLKAEVMVAPIDAGWNNDPRQEGSYFEPYTVISPQSSTDSEGPISDLGGMWNLPYALTSYAVSAAAIEDQADTARRIVHEASRSDVDLGGVWWKVFSTMTNSIGGVDINYQVEPPQLVQRDVVLLRITKKET
jgi:hypothetical protein